MTKVLYKSFNPAQFEQYSQQIREHQGEISQQQTGEVAKHFKVPLDSVLKLREELLAASTTTSDQVGKQTQEQRAMAAGGRKPAGMAQVKGVGVNPFMFATGAGLRSGDRTPDKTKTQTANAAGDPKWNTLMDEVRGSLTKVVAALDAPGENRTAWAQARVGNLDLVVSPRDSDDNLARMRIHRTGSGAWNVEISGYNDRFRRLDNAASFVVPNEASETFAGVLRDVAMKFPTDARTVLNDYADFLTRAQVGRG
jgi:hypothetical protein